MNPSSRDDLKEWNHHQVATPKKKSKQPGKKKTEDLSESDLKYLMGTSRPTYHRHKGALRQK